MFGGGGAIFGSTATQGFGMTQDFGATQGATQGAMQAEGGAKKARQEDKLVCLPVTIRSIQNALERKATDGGELTVFGVEPGQLLVVACVESVIRQTANLEMTLCDATGRMKARYFVTDTVNSQLEKVVPGCYVSVFGGARVAPVEHIAITGLRLVESADEVSYHMIEAAHTALRLQHGKPQPTTPTKQAAPAAAPSAAAVASPGPVLTPPKPAASLNPYAAAAAVAPVAQQQAPVAMAVEAKPAPAAAAPPSGAELRAAVMDMLRESSVGPEGLNQKVFAEKLRVNEAEVQSTLAGLVDDGEIYNTLDEHTFMAV